MTRAKTFDRIKRLELLTNLLKSEEHLIVGDLAEELGISTRTLFRDINILRERDLPIEADRGRGGGVRLHWSWGIGRLNLDYQESIDLLISLAIAEQMKSSIFMANLKPVRRKLMASFSPAQKHKINALRSRILVVNSASPFVLSTFEATPGQGVQALHRAFLLMQPLKIHYQNAQKERTKRTIEAHYLLLSYPVWYVLAWDHLKEDFRTFRCDRIEKSETNSGTFRLRPLSDFLSMIDGIEAITP